MEQILQASLRGMTTRFGPNIFGAASIVKTDDYVVQTTDFGRRLVMNSATSKKFTLPSSAQMEQSNGAKIRLVRGGPGSLTIQAGAGTKIGSGAVGGSIVIAEQDAYVDLEYCEALATWIAEIDGISMRLQEGLVTLKNRGVISGCAVSKSSTEVRNVSLAVGRFFLRGRSYDVQAMENCAAIPSNASGVSKTCYVYLWVDSNGAIQCDATDLDQVVPDYGVTLYEVTVPAENNGTNDPYLASVTLTDRRRIESRWPIVLDSPCYALIPLTAPIPGADYVVHLDPMQHSGPALDMNGFWVQDRLNNGFKIFFAGMSDDLSLRYMVSKASI